METIPAEDSEKSYIAHGKAYGYEGPDLRKYVEARLVQADEREQRVADRAQAQAQSELDASARQKDLAERAQTDELHAQITQLQDQLRARPESGDGNGEGTRRDRPMSIKVPKYAGKQSIEAYLELFEDAGGQNRYAEADWLIRLRVAQ